MFKMCLNPWCSFQGGGLISPSRYSSCSCAPSASSEKLQNSQNNATLVDIIDTKWCQKMLTGVILDDILKTYNGYTVGSCAAVMAARAPLYALSASRGVERAENTGSEVCWYEKRIRWQKMVGRSADSAHAHVERECGGLCRPG